jgi:hypothetical protein
MSRGERIDPEPAGRTRPPCHPRVKCGAVSGSLPADADADADADVAALSPS